MKQIKYIAISALAALLLGACTANFEEINTNPNAISSGEIEPSNVFEPLLIYGMNEMIVESVSLGYQIGQVVVSDASNVREEHRYNLNNGNFGGRWNTYFEWAVLADHMYNLAVSQNDPNYQAIGLTMKVYYMQGITDLFGGIPYKEAFKVSQGILQPVVETQQEVYQDMMDDLEKANSLYKTNTLLSGSDKDAMYSGDLLKWQKFTNSLYLRVLCRVADRSDSFTPSVRERIATVVGNPDKYPIFTSNADNAFVHYSASTVYYANTFRPINYSNESSFAGERHLSEQLLSMTVFDNGDYVDPRLPIWGKTRPAADYKWVGAISGCSKDYANSGTILNQESWLNYDTFVRDTAPNIVMSFDEVQFILAEAAQRGWIGGGAEQYYNQAITACCEKWNEWGEFAAVPTVEKQTDGSWKVLSTSPVNITSADIAALLARSEVAYNGTLQRIAEQKWLALFWVSGYEMYSEMRRTGYPEVKIGKGVVTYNYTDGKFMARWPYPQIAMSNNKAHYLEAIAAMGGSSEEDNLMTLPVWWSGQAVAKDNGQSWPHSFRTYTIREE